MDWYPLYNSLRIAAISSVLVFFAGIAAAYYAARLPRLIKGALDVVLTLAGGRVVFEDGHCPGIDEEELCARARERAHRLVKRAGFVPLTTPWQR